MSYLLDRLGESINEFVGGLTDIAARLLPKSAHAGPPQPKGPLRITLVQFGDYADAVKRFAAQGEENYYAQRYSVDFIASLAARSDIEAVTVVCIASNAPAERQVNGVHTVGIELHPKGQATRHGDLIKTVSATRPTHLIVFAPIGPLIRWGARQGLVVLPLFADSFRRKGLKARWYYRLLVALLNRPAIELVANHNIAASLDLQRIGVAADKIVPFDWPPVVTPDSFAAKTAPPSNRAFRLLFVGAISEGKGVGDAIRALARLRARGREVELTVIGRGEIETFQALAEREGVAPYVHFLGGQKHAAVLDAMRGHDAVLVPSHADFPEGLPMTLYEALCTRTPLIASNHPMFALKIRDRHNALVTPEKNPDALADRVEELVTSPALYAQLSTVAGESARDYLCPLKYDMLISEFLTPEGRRRLRDFALSRHAYI